MQQYPNQTQRDWPDLMLNVGMILLVALTVFILAWLVATIVCMIYSVGSTLLDVQSMAPVF